MARWLLIITFILLNISYAYASSDSVFDISLSLHKNGSAELTSFKVIEGRTLLPQISGDYLLKITGKNDEVLSETSFSAQFETHEDLIVDGKRQAKDVLLDKIDVHLRLPFNANAKQLELYKKDALLLLHTMQLCDNDKNCEKSGAENYFSCPTDCSSGSSDGYCDGVLDGKCDPDCIVKDLDIDCTCDNKVCDARENEKLCPQDCKVKNSIWQRIWNFIKSIF